MTIVLPDVDPQREALERARVECITPEDAERQDIRPLRIGILNVMPRAETYEYMVLHPLGRSILQIEPIWLRLESHTYGSSDAARISTAYVPYEQARSVAPLDGLLVTGAPVEDLEFEDVHYWPELTAILADARANIPSTLGICWGGMVLGYLLGLPKILLPEKVFGVFRTENLAPNHVLMGEGDDVFWCPHSRHAGVRDEDVERAERTGDIRVLARSREAGTTIFESPDHRFVAHLGHPEYEPERLVFEYERDRGLGRAGVRAPANLDLSTPVNTWRSHRNEIFSQWLRFIYEQTSRGR
jgi:homoserine O-succinyltransferase